MLTEKQAHSLARRYPIAARIGWLLACDAPANVVKGEKMIDLTIDEKDAARAIAYRDYCLALYSNKGSVQALA